MNLKNTHKDILMLQETWLTEQDNERYNILGFKKHFNNAGSVKGIAVYYRKEMFQHVADISQENMQLTKFKTGKLDIITVYRSEKGNSVEMLNHITTLITQERLTIICGDLNICYIIANKNNRITKHLKNSNFKQVVKYPTHIRGRLIDHVYHNLNNELIVNQYTPYYTDHDGICVIIKQHLENQKIRKSEKKIPRWNLYDHHSNISSH
jgi:exonuclease III